MAAPAPPPRRPRARTAEAFSRGPDEDVLLLAHGQLDDAVSVQKRWGQDHLVIGDLGIVDANGAALDGAPRLAVIPLGTALDRFVPVPSEHRYAYILLEDILAHFLQRYFPGETVAEAQERVIAARDALLI